MLARFHQMGQVVLLVTALLSPICVLAQTVDCKRAGIEAAEAAKGLSFTVSSATGTAGSLIKVIWRVSDPQVARARTPLYLVISAPAASRLQGKGFLAMAPGAIGPTRLGPDEGDDIHAYIPLNGRDAVSSGEAGFRFFRTGPAIIGARVVASDCPGAGAEKDRVAIQVAAGTPELVLQDRYSTESPARRIVSLDGRYRLDVFQNRFQVIDRR